MPAYSTEGLALTREELRSEIGFYLGYGRDSSVWDSGQLANINTCVAKGLRQFYAPTPLSGDNGVMHKWSFLEPMSTVTLYPDYAVSASRTLSHTGYDPANDVTRVLVNTTTFVASMVGATIAITGVTGSFTVRSVESTTVARIGGNIPFFSSATFTITSGSRFSLAPYVAGVLGSMWHSTQTGWNEVKVIPYTAIQAKLEANDNPTGYADCVGIMPAIDQGKWRQQVWYAVPYPLPDTQHVLTFKARTTTIPESSDNPYILGAVQHADTIIQSCLAAAELRHTNAKGVQNAEYAERLMASISLDRQLNAQDIVASIVEPTTQSFGADEFVPLYDYDVYRNGTLI